MGARTVLESILAAKKDRVTLRKTQFPLQELENLIKARPLPLNFSGALWGDQARLIAEVKQASPSKGLLTSDFHPTFLAELYARNGAAAISVLTEEDHFHGSLDDLAAVKKATEHFGLPVLRKDFIYDAYQLYEARAYGADASLLIVAMLSETQLHELLAESRKLWLQCLVEVHNENEIEVALKAGAEVLGINHRNLRTFVTDTRLTEELRPLIPAGKIVVAESGISSREDVVQLWKFGVNAVLVGEALVTAKDVAAKVRELAGHQK